MLSASVSKAQSQTFWERYRSRQQQHLLHAPQSANSRAAIHASGKLRFSNPLLRGTALCQSFACARRSISSRCCERAKSSMRCAAIYPTNRVRYYARLSNQPVLRNSPPQIINSSYLPGFIPVSRKNTSCHDGFLAGSARALIAGRRGGDGRCYAVRTIR